MVNEAIIIELGRSNGAPVERIVASGATILKGTLCKIADPNTASAATGTGEAFAGITAADKDGSDLSTTLAFYTEGVFDLTSTASPSITAGAMVCMSGANLIRAAVAGELLTGAIIGKAEETSSASEVIRVRLIGY